MDSRTQKKFRGSFDRLTKMGAEYCNDQRFKPLQGKGKPLWEFKEFDHRLYCTRTILEVTKVDVVLLDGWIKDKEGRTNREAREIEQAQGLYREYLSEYPGGITI